MPIQPAMNTEKWRRKALPALKTGPAVSHYEPLADTPDSLEAKKPRVFTKALRSLSSSSMESINSGTLRTSGSMRRLQKPQLSSSSMMERLHRRVSRDSTNSISLAETPGSPMEQSFSSMEVLQHGPLKADVSLLKARSEYLVLTDHCLMKFGGLEAARSLFPQLGESQVRNGGSHTSLSSKAAVAEVRFEIPLRSIVAVFKEEGVSPRFGIEVWWFSQSPKLAYCKTHLYFSMPREREEWLANTQRALRARLRRSPVLSTIPDNLKTRINHIVATTESQSPESAAQSLIFPVAKRTIGTSQKPNAAEEAHHITDGSSFYLVIGPCMCYCVEVLKAEYGTPAGELRVKSSSHGTVTLARFRASVASHEQRFVMSFRPPFGREVRLDLASTYYRRIIEALTRVDRILKPMWPQHFQQFIFDIKGLPPPLQLTSGNDLGGLERSLQACCTAFQVHMPKWKIDWRASCQPAFRLLPMEGSAYSALQLLAVFRALRYNSFFKALSFRDVDLSPLAGKKDYSPYGESVVHTSLNGWRLSDEHYDMLLQAPVLTQEVHAMAFASESIRSIDLTNVLGSQQAHNMRRTFDDTGSRSISSEILRPLLLLARSQLCVCHSIAMSGNVLGSGEIDDLANILVLDHVYFRKLELANCGLGDGGLSKLWTAIPGQAKCLEVLDTSNNQGIVKVDIIRHALRDLRAIKSLKIAGNIRNNSSDSIFDDAALHTWGLEELDLSGIALNDATVDSIASYLQTAKSQGLEILHLNKCGLTGSQIARIFRAMGQARRMTVHMNCSRVDEGIQDLCGAIACGYGPWSLFLQMVEFNYESSYVRLWKALTVNKTIECLSLAGSATPDAVSHAACQSVSEFFSNNTKMRYLDISGYHAKLDEGRLGKEFSTALSGLKDNTSIEHLRVRSQMLNVNIGDLAEAISSNKALHTLDCEDNGFNLSNFRHLVRHLDDNTTIRHFSAFSQEELDRAIQRSVDNAGSLAQPVSKRTSMISKLRSDKPQASNERPLLQQLKTEWDMVVIESGRILERNLRRTQEGEGQREEDGSSEPNTGQEGDATFSSDFGGLAFRDYESRRAKDAQGVQGSLRRSNTVTPGASMPDLRIFPEGQEMGVIRSNSTGSSDDVAVSPTSFISGSFPSAERTPPETDSPTEGLFAPPADLDEDLKAAAEYIHYENDAVEGLQMRPFRRPWSDSVSRIDEEED